MFYSLIETGKNMIFWGGTIYTKESSLGAFSGLLNAIWSFCIWRPVTPFSAKSKIK